MKPRGLIEHIFVEVRDYEPIMETLDSILNGSAQRAAVSSSELH